MRSERTRCERNQRTGGHMLLLMRRANAALWEYAIRQQLALGASLN